MPNYTFEDENGQTVEVMLPMSEAPGWGEWVEIDGKRLRRVVEIPVTEPMVAEYYCEIRSQPRWDPTAPRHNAMGVGVLLNKKEHADYAAKNTHLVWD